MREGNDDARRHLLLQLRFGIPQSPLAATAAATPYVVASALILGFIIVGVFLRPPNTSSAAFTLNVTPLYLDFGPMEVGKKAVKPILIETSSVSNLTWKVVSGNPQGLSIARSNVTKESDTLSEVVYDVTADTSNLHVGKYSATYNIDVGGVKDQQIHINFQVIPLSTKPLPAKLNVDPLALDFGTQNVDSQETKLLTVSNSGQMDLNWRADKGNATWLTLDASQGTIPPGGLPKVIKVMMNTAPSTVGSYSTFITFISNGGTVSVSVKLSVVVTPTTNGPQVLGVSPSSGLNDGGTKVVLTGTGFTDASLVSFGPIQVKTSGFRVNSDTQITVVSPPANKIDFNSTVDVIVTTPVGTSAINSADHFTYSAPAIPTVKQVSPNIGSVAGGTNVKITGTGFTGATEILFGTVSVPNNNFIVNSDTQITAVSPAPALAGSCARPCYIQKVDVTVTSPSGTSNTNSNDIFTYIFPPIVSGIEPITGPANGGTVVTITGLYFTGVTGVSFNGTAATNVTFINDTQITAISPAGSGTVDVTVTTPGGTSNANLDDQFTYIPPPSVKYIMPTEGPVAGGTKVAIFGSFFTNTMSVSFGGTLATNVTFISDTEIIAVSPMGNANTTVPVIVTTLGGSSVTNNDDQFTYLPSPPIVNITSPDNNSFFPSSQSDLNQTDPITFTAVASDSSGQPLTGTALQWTLDGKFLGTGESFSATLPSGCVTVSHTVQVVATDTTSGLSASATITVKTGQVC
jgi:hypothetical protein